MMLKLYFLLCIFTTTSATTNMKTYPISVDTLEYTTTTTTIAIPHNYYIYNYVMLVSLFLFICILIVIRTKYKHNLINNVEQQPPLYVYEDPSAVSSPPPYIYQGPSSFSSPTPMKEISMNDPDDYVSL